jgi:hypothetical protein
VIYSYTSFGANIAPGGTSCHWRRRTCHIGDQVLMPADLERLHKELREFERIDAVSDEMRAVIEELWPELVPRLPRRTSTERVWPLRAVAARERARISLGFIRQAANCSQVFGKWSRGLILGTFLRSYGTPWERSVYVP